MRQFTFLITLLMLLPFILLGDELPAVLTEEMISNEEFFQFLMQSLGGLSGLGALGIAALVTQIIVGAMKTPLFGGMFNNLAGKFKLMIVSGVSLVSGIVSLLAVGLDIGTVLIHSFVLTTAQVFAHQIYSQLFVKED